MRDKFAKQLDELYISVKDMGILCEKAIEKAAKAAELIDMDEIDEAMNRYSVGKKKRATVKKEENETEMSKKEENKTE